MELKAGYKQTEVGVIPEEWSLERLGDISDLDVGLSKPKIEFGSGCPVVTVQDLYDGSSIDISSLKRVVVTTEEIQKYKLAKDDILIGNASVKRSGIGYANRFDGADEDVIFAKYAYRARTSCTVKPLFLHHVLRADFCRQWIVSNSQTGTLTNLNKPAAKGIPIPVPATLAEQDAIAEALSDADALIESLDQLITKKRELKQAAMQQLLTGQTRLPGFTREWEVKRLGDVADMGSGGTPLSSVPDYYDGSIPWVAISDMTKGGKIIERTERNLTTYGFTNSAAQMFPVGTVLYAMYASLGECSIAGVPLCTSQAILGIRPNSNLNADFLYYYLTSLKSVVKTLGQQGTQANLNKGIVQDFRFGLPAVPEQTAITTVLSDMDTELAELEARLAKARQIKQGMMQELLTGRIRLL